MENIKSIAIAILITLGVVGIYQYTQVWKDAQEKISAAQKERDELKNAKVELEKEVVGLTAAQAAKDQQISDKSAQILQFEEQIKTIKAQNEKLKLKTVTQVDKLKIAYDFIHAFELQDVKGVRLLDIPTDGGIIKSIPSIAVPIDFAKLATNAKNDVIACQKQSALQEEIIALNSDITRLTNEKLELEKQKTMAYAEGYEKAFTMYNQMNERYVELLSAPPKVDLAPNWLQIAGGVLAGGIICAL